MMQKIDMYSYKYMNSFSTGNESPFSKIEDYEIDVPCLNKNENIKYLFRSYCFRDYLYITDIFPAMWNGQDDCFKRIISREGYSVNMRKLSITCLAIFVKHYIESHIDNAMLVSGSYEYGEDDSNISRKLRLYWDFFSPILKSLSLRAVQIWELNAFVLINKNSNIEDHKIIKDYSDFKNNKRKLQ